MINTNLNNGDIVKHFKREFLSEEGLKTTKYLYEIIDMNVTHTETGDVMVCYKALYQPFNVYVRPKEMFIAEVDRNKYPESTQLFRFQKIDDNHKYDFYNR